MNVLSNGLITVGPIQCLHALNPVSTESTEYTLNTAADIYLIVCTGTILHRVSSVSIASTHGTPDANLKTLGAGRTRTQVMSNTYGIHQVTRMISRCELLFIVGGSLLQRFLL